MRLKSLFAAMTLVLGLAAPGLAVDIMVNVTGTVNTADPGMGYNVGDPVSFFWVVDDYAPATPAGSPSYNRYMWQQENANTEPSLWESAGGTGIGGTYKTAPGTSPFERLQVETPRRIRVALDTDEFNTTTNNHGIYLNADTNYVVRALIFEGNLAATGFSGFSFGPFGSPLPNPTDYLSGYLNTYTSSTVNFELAAVDAFQAEKRATFIASSVTISQVPEPSTYALGGLATAVMAFIARRSKANRKG